MERCTLCTTKHNQAQLSATKHNKEYLKRSAQLSTINGKKNNFCTIKIFNPRCTTKHTGTSASAPMAAAIIALTLQVMVFMMKIFYDDDDDENDDNNDDDDENGDDDNKDDDDDNDDENYINDDDNVNDDESAQANPDLTWRDVQHIMVRDYYLKQFFSEIIKILYILYTDTSYKYLK